MHGQVKEHGHHEEEMGDHHEKGHHDHARSSHMQHMNEVKNWLKKELGHTYDQPLPPVTEEQLTAGKKIYLQSCAPCHGKSGKRDGPASGSLEQKPSNFTDPAHARFYSDRGRLHIIKKGIEGTPMAGWEDALNKTQIQWVYAYVRSLSPPEHKETHHHKDSL